MPDRQPEVTDEIGSIRVLYVDDEPDFAALAGQFLTRETDRITVVTEERAATGLDRLDEGGIDCVVSDYDMPEMDGLDFLVAVRERRPNLPFILVTGRGSEELASEAISAGVTDYLQKRGGREQYTILANRIQNAVAQARAEREVRHHRRVSEHVREVMRSVVGVTDAEEITQAICDHVADADPYRFAWVGTHDPETGRLEPRASAGVEDGYLDDLTVTVGEMPTGNGPAGVAFRERRLVTSQCVAQDPSFEPWRGRALERGYESVAAIPLAHEGTVHGVLCVYAACADAFDDTERALLGELGDATGRALDAAQREATRAERENATAEATDDPHQRRSHTVAVCADAMAASADGMAIHGPNGRFEYVNEAHARLYGYDAEELVGESWRRLYGPEERARFETEIMPTVSRVGRWRGEVIGRRADGTTFPQEVSLTELDGPELVCVVRDITHHRETERELERRNERLDEFASVVSHDLRGPLGVASGNVELARRATEDPAVVERLDAVDTALGRIDALVEDVLSIARGDNRVEATVVSLERTVADCWQGDDERVTVAENVHLVADRGRLQRLIENLFRNSVEHGSTGSRPEADDSVELGTTGGEHGETGNVDITVGPLSEESGFFVEDDGPGIPAEARDTVFEPGYTTSETGTGLGLDIVRRITDEHGWDCRVTASAAGGARFEFTAVDIVGGAASDGGDAA